jgi:hypothetical protein
MSKIFLYRRESKLAKSSSPVTNNNVQFIYWSYCYRVKIKKISSSVPGHTEISLRPSAIPGGNPPGDGQSTVGWGDAGFEPGTAGQQSGTLPLSHHASQCVRTSSPPPTRSSGLSRLFNPRFPGFKIRYRYAVTWTCDWLSWFSFISNLINPDITPLDNCQIRA